MAGCNEVQSSSVNTDYNASRMEEVFRYWSKKTNIKNRFSTPEGLYLDEMSYKALKSYASDVLDFPWVREQNFTDKQLSRLKVAIDGFEKDLGGKFRNIAGIAATPRGLARLDPASQKMMMGLERAKNYERNQIAFTEQSIQEVKDLILVAHVNRQKGSKILGNKSYKEYRSIRKKILKAKDENVELKAYKEIENFFRQDNGRLLNEYNELVKLRSKKKEGDLKSELDIAIENGYINAEGVKTNYDKKIVQAVMKSHDLLDRSGRIDIIALNKVADLVDLKYSKFSNERRAVVDKLQSAAKRIEDGIVRGDYYPKITLETMYDIKSKLEDILPQGNMNKLNNNLNELMSISDGLLAQVSQPPKNTKAASRNLNLLWESDPYVILDRYSRDAIQFNKNVHIQHQYLDAMKMIPHAKTDFLKGLKTFIMEEYLVANDVGKEQRPEWVNSTVRIVNGFQTARTMGLNVTGGVKNAGSVVHYLSKVGRKAVVDSRQAYNGSRELRNIVDRVEQEAGFLFTPGESAILMEGLVGRDGYKRSDLKFDQSKGQYVYRDESVRDLIDKSANKTLGTLLTFHRWTENGQRRFMFRTSFIQKYQELIATSNLEPRVAERFAKNFALKMVNGWAYEYAPFAKNKYVRGDGYIVDEIGETYVVANHLKPVSQRIAFHLLHYPMSLLETHISELKGAGQSIKAGNFDSPEMRYLMNYAGVFGMIQLGSILMNANLNNILENETLNRISRIYRDLYDYDNDDRATFGLLSEVTGPTVGHLKYLSIVSGLIKLDTPAKKILLGNVDYTDDTEATRRYRDYQYSTEFGRFKHKTWKALRDGRSSDLFYNYLLLYPEPWIKSARKKIGLKKSKSKFSTEEVLRSLSNL
jgi:hypothetical protein